MIGERVPSLQRTLPVTLIVLFGSYAKGNYTVASDIDLLVVYSGERREDAFAMTKKTISILGLEPHLYTKEEHQRLEDTIEKMTAGGIVLFRA